MPKSFSRVISEYYGQSKSRVTRNVILGKVVRGTNVSVNEGRVDTSERYNRLDGRVASPIRNSHSSRKA